MHPVRQRAGINNHFTCNQTLKLALYKAGKTWTQSLTSNREEVKLTNSKTKAKSMGVCAQ